MKNKVTIIWMVILIFFSLTSSAYASSTQRLAGYDLYDTSVAIVENGWLQSDYAVLAYGGNYPDALSAVPLAKKYDAPILLTSGNKLTSVTKQTLVSLHVNKVFIVGGTAVVPTSIESELKLIGITPTRIAGLDRYETSLKIAQQINSPSALIITTGDDFPDALSIAPIAGVKQIPILLVPKDVLPDATRKYIASLKVHQTYVLGDSSIISDLVCQQLPNPKRIVGVNKYERNIAINKEFDGSFNSSSLCIATGQGFSDALTGAAYAAKINAPIILVNSNPPTNTKDYYQQRLKKANNFYVFGGTSVVPDKLIQGLNSPDIPNNPPVVSRSDSSELVSHALSLVGVPYLWGGTSRSGFDCSGFTQYVFEGSGINLPRISFEQYKEGSSVSRDQLQAGDLVFFATYEPGASHVGIYIGGEQFVDAASKGVVISDLRWNYYKDRYIGARRV